MVAMPQIATGVEGAPATMGEIDRILADSVFERARLDRLMEDLDIRRESRESRYGEKRDAHMREHRLTDESQRFARRMSGLSIYPPWDPRSWIMQGSRPRITMLGGENGARSSAEKDMDSMLAKNDEARGATGGDMCPCGGPTCPAQAEARMQQSIAKASRFEEMVATRGLPEGMLPPGLYPHPIGEVRGPTTLWPGLMFPPTSVPMVPMPPPGFPGPNNMWPGRMFAPPAVPMVRMPPRDMPGPNNMWPRRMFAPPTPMVMYNPNSNTSGPNTMWPDRMFAPRFGPVPRQPERDMHRGDEATKRQADDAKLAHQRSFGRMEYLWGKLTQEEQKLAALEVEMDRMVKGNLTTEEAIIKLGKKVFDELDAKERLVVIKQKLGKTRKEPLAKGVACEMAGKEHSSCERWKDAEGKGGVKDSKGKGKGKGKEVATDVNHKHSEAEAPADASRDLPEKESPPPVESEEDQICADCGGVKEDVQDDKSTSGESFSVV